MTVVALCEQHGRQNIEEKIERQKTQRQASQQHDGEDGELHKAFQRLRQPKTPVPEVIQSCAAPL